MTNGRLGLWEESDREDAFVIDHGGRRYVCPRYPRLRMLEGLLAFRNAYQGPTASMLVPEAAAARAARELDRLHERHPQARSHILTSPFFVPLRWFAAFDPTERILVDTESGLTVKYRTRLRDAVRRMRRTAQVLDDAGFDETVIEPVTDLIAWLGHFSHRSVLELDYGDVAALFETSDLVLDESAADVAASIDALEDGDFETAGDHYAAAAMRWAHAQSLIHVN